ncbi:MAG: phosphatidate cytidylyltransferase [Proteobacteria bacterium]|nr:phosphatidate cytidylyltransferase [Pseudomonadota bacterium]
MQPHGGARPLGRAGPGRGDPGRLDRLGRLGRRRRGPGRPYAGLGRPGADYRVDRFRPGHLLGKRHPAQLGPGLHRRPFRLPAGPGRPSGGRVLLLFALFAVIAADVGAYFAGHMWGKHKLAPSISPGKTIEGVAGGALSSAVLGAVFAGLWLPDTSAGAGALLGALLALVSVGGDLLESALKRAAGVKDSGGILPGHGGVLDRVDGILIGGATFLLLRMLLWG